MKQKIADLKSLLKETTSIILRDNKDDIEIPIKSIFKVMREDPNDIDSILGDFDKRKRALETILSEFGR